MFVLMSHRLCVTIAFVVICALSIDAINFDKDLVFRLYTRQNPNDYFVLKPSDSSSIVQSHFNPNRPTRIFIHGFRSKEKVITRYLEAYLKLADYNFIAVDWIKAANTYNYYLVKLRVKPISEKLAELVDTLVANGMKLHDVTIVGHSLGAHIAGRAAKQLKSGGKIATIIGLDPALYGFDLKRKDKRLADSDAEYVQVIHTDANNLGFVEPIGHADMYPNKGREQPGCPATSLMEKCSHSRSHHLFLESLTSNFPAIHCVSYEEIKGGRCSFNNVTTMMGGDIFSHHPKEYGVFYLETESEPPFVVPDHRNFKNIQIVR